MCVRVCVRARGPAFRRLYRVAGGPGSQSLIYSGSFEIIKLTHLSDGERRNAKRSPGEVPAAPTPNLSCLQIAQSLHHNRWDSCLSFLPLLHTNGLRRGECPPHFLHTRTPRCSKGYASHRQEEQTGRGMFCTQLWKLTPRISL